LSFARDGVQLDYRFSNTDTRLSSDVHGALVTYQQVAAKPELYDALCRRRRTFVIFDEIHHAADQATWGVALRQAFGAAERRLALSGTPLRTDGERLPFVRYDRDDCVAGYTYSYSQGLLDKVCREVVFAMFDGEAKWVSHDRSLKRARFSDKLKKALHSERLRTHLLADSLGTVIENAHKRLMNLRRGEHKAAAGLIVCMNVDHARNVAATLAALTGCTPEIIVSDDDDARRKLREYDPRRHPWIVSVNMVSEGVDIPDLRVGIYATNVRQWQYFIQFIGRFVRMLAHLRGDQRAFVYIPADPTITAFARAIKTEIFGAKKRKSELERESLDREIVPHASAYKAIGASVEFTGTLHGELPPIDHVELAPIATPAAAVMPAPRLEHTPLVDEKHALKQTVLKLVNQASQQFKVPRKSIYATLKRRCGGDMKGASLKQLHTRKETLERWIQRNNYDGFR
jgi:superfamily II DNA or RNA helicase